jgi:hypothetical protein
VATTGRRSSNISSSMPMKIQIHIGFMVQFNAFSGTRPPVINPIWILPSSTRHWSFGAILPKVWASRAIFGVLQDYFRIRRLSSRRLKVLPLSNYSLA